MRTVPRKRLLLLVAAAAAIAAPSLIYLRTKQMPAACGEGRLEPETITAKASLGGRVKAVLVRRGDFVNAGQPLLRFHEGELADHISQAEQALSQTPAADLATTASFVQRVPPATWANLLQSDPARLEAETEYVAALAAQEAEASPANSARLRRAEAHRILAYRRADGLRPETLGNLRTLRDQAQRTLAWLASQRDRLEVRAPAAGAIEILDLSEGDWVIPGAAAALIDLPGRWIVTAHGTLAQGRPIRIELPGGTSIHATVESNADDQIRARVSTSSPGLRAGAPVKVCTP